MRAGFEKKRPLRRPDADGYLTCIENGASEAGAIMGLVGLVGLVGFSHALRGVVGGVSGMSNYSLPNDASRERPRENFPNVASEKSSARLGLERLERFSQSQQVMLFDWNPSTQVPYSHCLFCTRFLLKGKNMQ